MPLAAVVRAHAVARAVFDVDRMWDAVRPLDNQVSAATQVELRTEATRLAERADPLAAAAARRWPPSRPPPIADVTDRFAAPVAAVRAGLPGWLLGARGRRRTPSGPRRLPRRGRAGGAGRRGRRRARCCRRRSTSPSSPSGPARPIALAGQVMQCLVERLGLVPLRELVLGAAPRPPLALDGPRLAARRPGRGAGRRSPRTCSALRARDDDDAAASWSARGWRPGTPPRPRAAAQLADIAAGDRQELAELLVAVRTLRGLRRRRQARRLPRPEEK